MPTQATQTSLHPAGLEGLRIFQEGIATDATIRFGINKVKVHKMILIARSDWFKAAFRDSSHVVIDISEPVEPMLVEWMLEWCYTGVLSPFYEKAKLAFLDFDACLRFMRVADYFLLEDLQSQLRVLIQAGVHELFRYSMRKIVPTKRHAFDGEHIRGMYAEYFKAVEFAYATEDLWAQRVFIEMVEHTHMWLFVNPYFRILCKKIVPFYRILYEKFVDIVAEKWWTAHPRGDCFFCGATPRGSEGDEDEVY